MRPKPIDSLRSEDLLAYPIWEYATDSEDEFDETYVRPIGEHYVPAQFDHAVYHAACDVVTRSGKALIGFMSICNRELHDVSPIVVGSQEGEYFCLDYAPDRRNRAAFEAVIGSPYETSFPVRWKLRVLVEGEREFRSGEYGGAI